MTVSCACPPALRRSRLAHAFARLLDDQSRWVRMSAFQTLGPFISTFADPSVIGLSYNQMGELVVINPEGAEFKINTPGIIETRMRAEENLPDDSFFYRMVFGEDPPQERSHRERLVVYFVIQMC